MNFDAHVAKEHSASSPSPPRKISTPARVPPADTPALPTATFGSPRTEVAFPSGDLQLHGYVWKPDGNRPFPAVLWNHGSGKAAEMSYNPKIWPIFVKAGFVLFIPYRRGQGLSPGTWMDDLVQQVPRDQQNKLVVQLHETVELSDQLAGLAFLKTLPYVDANRITVAGWSYGGIQTILGAEATIRYRAAFDCAGAALSWEGNPDLRERLVRAVQKINIPVFLAQAENDASLGPTQTLAAELNRLRKTYQATIYPPWHTSQTNIAEPAGHLIRGEGGDVWGPDVIPFINAAMK